MHPTRNTLPLEVRRKSIEMLQLSLADGVDLTSHAKQAHWNVKGPNFIALHELFDKLYSEMSDYSDILAERLVALGGQAYGTIREAAKRSSLKEYPIDISASAEHVEAISDRLAAFGQTLLKAIDAATELGDQGTADTFTEVSRGIDKLLWFVESHSL